VDALRTAGGWTVAAAAGRSVRLWRLDDSLAVVTRRDIPLGGDAGSPARSLSLVGAPDGATLSMPLVGGGAHDPSALLLDAAAALFTAGGQLNWDPLRAPGARLLSDLPTYPFRRKRYWIEEPSRGAGAPDVRDGDASGRAATASRAPLPSGTLTPAALEEHLLAELRDVLQETEELDTERSFLDAGGDSFTSTLFISKVEERFDVGLTPEDLPLDLPLSEMISKLAANVTLRDTGAEREPTP
ncbi:acyl carrier protein, partial [Streptomyces griseus]|uniref:acyl carrier protein n=1 Tax=Streptomyces griseus TaxID=1911 RepID=UPI0036CF7CB4